MAFYPDPLTFSCPWASLAPVRILAQSSEGLEALLSLHFGPSALVTGGLRALQEASEPCWGLVFRHGLGESESIFLCTHSTKGLRIGE